MRLGICKRILTCLPPQQFQGQHASHQQRLPHLEYEDLCPVADAVEAVGQHTQTGVIAQHRIESLLHGGGIGEGRVSTLQE